MLIAKEKISFFREREREAPSVQHLQPVPPSGQNLSAYALRTQTDVDYASYWGGFFCPFGCEWLFPSKNGVWGQYQGLSMIPTIMLFSPTGTLELDQRQDLDWFPWSVSSPTLFFLLCCLSIIWFVRFWMAFTYTQLHTFTRQTSRHSWTHGNTNKIIHTS